MFGSEIVSRAIYEQLTGPAAMPAAFSGRMVGTMVRPQHIALPALLFYPEYSAYTGVLGTMKSADIDFEQLRFVVRVMCEGTSTDPIRPAAQAQLDHFAGLILDVEDDGQTYQITFSANGEVPLTTVMDDTTFYRQLGTIYDVTISRGG